MVKIKIIDLLNKKSTNEIMPKKIKYSLNELDFQIIVYDEEAGEYVYEKCPNEIWTPSWHHINDEVEIIEEEKKIPEKIEYYDDSIAWVIDDVGQLSDVDKVIIDKLNEVLDYLKSKGE